MGSPLTRAQLPRGVRDLFGEDALALRLLEARLLEGFRRWGYRDVAPPSFELHDNMAMGLGEALDRAMVRFVDPDGALMALRADFTNGIARMLATKLAAEPRPVRVCYAGPVFRNERALWGKQREFHQAGVELIGAGQVAADVEVIALALETLDAVGLTAHRLNLGHVGLFRALLPDFGAAGADAAAVAQVREAVDDRDRGRVDELARALALPDGVRGALLALPGLVGGRDVIARARPLSGCAEWHTALDRLGAVVDGLEALGLARHVLLDLGEVKGIEYYTGVVFEGFVPGSGFPVLSGGRYDALHAQFGRAGPAVGLALTLERLLLAVSAVHRVPGRTVWNVAVDVGAAGAAAAHALARQLREHGADVTFVLGDEAPQAALVLRGVAPGSFDVSRGDGTILARGVQDANAILGGPAA